VNHPPPRAGIGYPALKSIHIDIHSESILEYEALLGCMDVPLSEPASSLMSLEDALIRAEYAVAKNYSRRELSNEKAAKASTTEEYRKMEMPAPARSE
jgi:hypothetical protein